MTEDMFKFTSLTGNNDDDSEEKSFMEEEVGIEEVDSDEVVDQEQDIYSEELPEMQNGEEPIDGGFGDEEDDEMASIIDETALKKNPWIVIGIIGVIAAFVIGFALVKIFSGGKDKNVSNEEDLTTYQQAISDLWDDLVDGSKEIQDTNFNLTDMDSFTELSIVLNRQITLANDKIQDLLNIQKDPAYSESNRILSEFLLEYKEYLQALNDLLLLDPETYTDADFSDIDPWAIEVSSQAVEFRNQTDFIKKDMEDTVFASVPSNIKHILEQEKLAIEDEKKQEEEDKQKEEEEKKKEEEEAQKEDAERLQAEQDKQDAQRKAEDFLVAYRSKNLSSVMNLLSSDAGGRYMIVFGTDEIKSYTILSTELKDDYYQILARIVWEIDDPTFVPDPLDPALVADRIEETNTEEIQVLAEDDEWVVDYVEWLE